MYSRTALTLTSLLLSTVLSMSPASPNTPVNANAPRSGSGLHRRCFGNGGWGWGWGCGVPAFISDSCFTNANQFCESDFNRNTQAAVFCDNINDFNAANSNFCAANNNVAVI